MTSRVYWLWLSSRGGISARTAGRLLEVFGSPEAVYAADRTALIERAGLSKAQVDALSDRSFSEAERIMQKCSAKNISIISLNDTGYPAVLRQIEDPPIVLYTRGQLPDWNRLPCVAIVGTRHPSTYGLATAASLAQGLTQAGFLVISGMALGVDGAAARGALRVGKTVAVLGSGVDVCQPRSHEQLMGDILLSGAVISEYPPEAEGIPAHFPERNRIISGMSVATVVVEAPTRRSGALITARLALEQGRDVFAVPANLDAPFSEGCNSLIRDHEAQLLTGPMDLVREYAHLLPQVPDETLIREIFSRETKATMSEQITKIAEPEPVPHVPEHPNDISENASVLSPEEQLVVNAIGEGAQTSDALIARTGMTAAQALSLLTILELDGVVGRSPGGLLKLL